VHLVVPINSYMQQQQRYIHPSNSSTSKIISVHVLINFHLISISEDVCLLGFVSDHRVVMILQVPREALEFAGMSINFRSGKFGYSICPIFSKGHAEIFREF
jgi:hypothetical protein